MSRLFILYALLLMVSGCDLFDHRPKEDPKPQLKAIELQTSDLYMVAGTQIPIKISLVGRLDNDHSTAIDDDYTLFSNGEDLGSQSVFNSEIPGLFELYAEYENLRSDTLHIEVRKARTYEPAIFTIIFHVVHDGEEVGEGYNISSQVIVEQMEMLRTVFSSKNLNYTPNSTSPAMFFKLATKTPGGKILEEPGINRIQRPDDTYSILFEEWMWEHYWDPDYYINVWVGDTKNGYSFGVYPSLSCESNLGGLGCTDSESPSNIEGIALELSNLWKGNWVFPHEMGHLFGLFHVFGPSGCHSDTDYAGDTHYYDRETYEAGITGTERTSCDDRDYVSFNIMDYWDQPEGGRDLTYDQVERMRYVVERGRFRAGRDPETNSNRVRTRRKP